MLDPLEIQEFERIIDCGQDVDFNADLDGGIVRVRSGLTPTQYVEIGMKVASELPQARLSVGFVGDVD